MSVDFLARIYFVKDFYWTMVDVGIARVEYRIWNILYTSDNDNVNKFGLLFFALLFVDFKE